MGQFSNKSFVMARDLRQIEMEYILFVTEKIVANFATKIFVAKRPHFF
jgi:hypothetical protein